MKTLLLLSLIILTGIASADWETENVYPNVDGWNTSLCMGVYYPHICGGLDGGCYQIYRRSGYWQLETGDCQEDLTSSSIALYNAQNSHMAYSAGNSLYYMFSDCNTTLLTDTFCTIGDCNVSIAVGSDNIPRIAYCGSDGHLFYSSKTGSDWEHQIAAPSCFCTAVSLILDESSGTPEPVICYTTSEGLWYTFQDSDWQTIQLENSGSCGCHCISAAMAEDTILNIAYRMDSDICHGFINPDTGIWESSIVQQGSASDASVISMAFNAEGLPRITHGRNDIMSDVCYCECDDQGDWTCETIDTGLSPSMGIDNSNKVYVAYGLGDNGVNIATLTPLGIEEEQGGSIRITSSIAPNPVISSMSIQLTMACPSEVSLSLFDICGRCVDTGVTVTLPSGCSTVDMGTGGLSPGLYICRVETEGISEYRLFTIAR